MQNGFKLIENAGGTTVIEFQDILNEAVAFPTNLPIDANKLKVDFTKVTYINSTGLRNWIVWLGLIKTKYPLLKFEVDGATMAYLRHLSMFAEILPKDAVVLSYFYDYFCPNCNDEQSIRIENNAKNVIESSIKCASCATPMNLEIPIETYEILLKHAPGKT